MVPLLSIGEKSPWQIVDVPVSGGASLILDYSVPVIVMMFPNPTNSELRIFKEGRIDFAFDRIETSGFLICRFRARIGKPLGAEVPFHVGKEETRNRNIFMLPTEDGLPTSMVFALQDERAVVRALRIASMPRFIDEAIRKLVIEQVVDSEKPDWELRHHRQRRTFNERCSTLEEAFRKASMVCTFAHT